jgi:hypothetical protein
MASRGNITTLIFLMLATLTTLGMQCATKDPGYCADCAADGGNDGGVGGDASVACGGACGGATPYCKESTNTCVECLQTEQCTDGTKSVCDTSTNTCVACNDNTQCSHIAGKGICDQGTCVGCTEATEAEACGGFYCDPAAKTCTTTPRGTTAFCNECVSDSECANNAEGVRRCVAMGYNGAPRADGKKFCLIDKATLPPSANGICPVQMFDSVNATSVGGVTSAYCSPRQTLTTCEATLDFLKSGGCTDATKCGANLSPTDGMCEDDGNSKQCTYRCLGDDDCATGVKCRTGVTTRYCCTASGVAGCN